ncbi:MAG: hypothetical protein U0599_16785 [Vicinamibacteria bacterium]
MGQLFRYRDGTFFVSTFSGTTNRTYVYTTKDPEKGPWKASSFAPSLHDHSPSTTAQADGGGDLRRARDRPRRLEMGGFKDVLLSWS